ncbi:MAG: hypothetical protein HZC38_20775 [Chloroflexi bacterium]|nr:hypothetical protein [Chloroflexota bacterium]
MLNFSPVREKTITIAQLAATVKFADLKPLTNEMIDLMLKLIKDCVDADVVFAPNDPNASDEYAEKDGDKNAAWTLGHVIVHTRLQARNYRRLIFWHGLLGKSMSVAMIALPSCFRRVWL